MTDSPSPHPTSGPEPLLRNLVLFGRLLRRLGIKVTPEATSQLAGSLMLIGIERRDDVKSAARAILINRREDIGPFDEAFDLFWRATMERGGGGTPLQMRTARQARQTGPNLSGQNSEDTPGEETDVLTWSFGETLRRKDFALLQPHEILAAQLAMQRIQWRPHRRSYRLRPGAHGRQLDMRRSLRRALPHGGELLDLAKREPKLKRRKLVLLCDISGSMDRYTGMLLHFLHSVGTSFDRTEVFVFGTRLTRLTRALQRRNPNAAIAAAAHQVHDWAGGTRIGEALHEFNHRWARRVLGQGAIVMIISDGWDRGDPVLLAREMERLQRSSYRLIWLNPLLGAAGYQPLTQGIQAALPYVDDHLPVHNLHSLEELAQMLNRVQEGRPERRQGRS